MTVIPSSAHREVLQSTGVCAGTSSDLVGVMRMPLQEHAGSYRNREELITGKVNNSQDLQNRKLNNLITEREMEMCYFYHKLIR